MALQVWLPLSRGEIRNQGLANINFINNSLPIDELEPGKIGYPTYFFDNSGYIKESTYDWTNFNTSEFSLCCWYKEPSPVASGNSQMICIGTSSGWNNIRIGLLRRTSNGYPLFSVSDGSTALQYNFTASNFTLDKWNHITVTYNNGELKMYLNGALDKTLTTTITPVLNSSQHLGIGAASNGAEKLTGHLQDIRIYDHCLSAKEVEEISKGLVIHYKLNLNQYDNNLVTSLTAGGQTSVSNGVVTTSGTNADTYFTINLSENIVEGTSYIISCDGEDIPDGTCWTFPLGWQGNTDLLFQIYNGHNSYCFTANAGSWGTKRIFMDDGGSPNSARYTGVSTKIKNFFVSKINTLIDYSGYNNSGIINDISAKYVNDSARYNTSLYHAQGNNSAIYLAKGDCNIPDSTNLTFAWWMKPTQWGAQTSGLWSTSANGAATDYNTTAANMRDSYFDCCNTSGSCKRVEAASMVTLNEWHHYALTYDGANLKVYKDGVQKTSTAQTGALKCFTNIFLFYSKAGGVNRNTSGYISDFRVYVTTLTAEQLLELYNTSATIDKNGNVYAREVIE